MRSTFNAVTIIFIMLISLKYLEIYRTFLHSFFFNPLNYDLKYSHFHLQMRKQVQKSFCDTSRDIVNKQLSSDYKSDSNPELACFKGFPNIYTNVNF